MEGILWSKCKALRFAVFRGCLAAPVFKIKAGDRDFAQDFWSSYWQGLWVCLLKRQIVLPLPPSVSPWVCCIAPEIRTIWTPAHRARQLKFR